LAAPDHPAAQATGTTHATMRHSLAQLNRPDVKEEEH
jgi:hypothetical protein